MHGIIFGKLYFVILEKIISQWAELKGIRVRGQTCFKERWIHFAPHPHITYFN